MSIVASVVTVQVQVLASCMNDKNDNGIEYGYVAFKIMQLFPDSSPREIEHLLERMQDFGLLNEQGDKLKKLFWDYFWNGHDE